MFMKDFSVYMNIPINVFVLGLENKKDTFIDNIIL